MNIIKGEKEIRKLKKGDSFGELALYYNTVRDATVRAIDEVHCLALARDSLNNILGDKIQKITYRNIEKWAFDRSEFLSKLTNIQKEKLMENFEIKKTTEEGEILIEKGQICKKVVILIEGAVLKEQDLITQKGTSFGDEFLLIENQNKM